MLLHSSLCDSFSSIHTHARAFPFSSRYRTLTNRRPPTPPPPPHPPGVTLSCVFTLSNSVQVRRVAYLGFANCVLFMAYNTASSFFTTLYPTSGFYSFVLVYLGFALGSIAAVPVGRNVRASRMQFVAAITYVALLAVLNSNSDALFLTLSLVNGLGAGFLWVNNSLYIVRASASGPNPIGKLSAIFFGIWTTSTIVGCTLVVVAVLVGASTAAVVWLMVGIGAFAVVLMFFVRDVAAVERGPSGPDSRRSLLGMLRAMRAVLPRIPICILFYAVQQGANVALSWALLPTLVSTRLELISIVLIGYGVTSAIASFLWGLLHDKHGFRAMLFVHAINGIVAAVTVYVLSSLQASWHYFILAGCLCGAFDMGNNNLTTILISLVGKDVEDIATGCYRVVFSASVAIFSVLALHLSTFAYIALCLLSLFAALSSYFLSKGTSVSPQAAISPDSSDATVSDTAILLENLQSSPHDREAAKSS
jgi:predicted MFS family arabinose efflux permease